jgi:hypothetical protein
VRRLGVTVDGRLVAAVERKSLADLVSSLINGKLRYALGDLAALPRAAVVVEDRYSQVFKLDWVRPAVVADGLAELQIRWRSYGGPPEDECLVEFGLNRDQVHERCMELVCRCYPNAYRDAERTSLLRAGGMLLPDRPGPHPTINSASRKL